PRRRRLHPVEPLSTTFFTAFDQQIEAAPSLLTSVNSLIFKEFSVSSAPEVGRIIERSAGASRVNLQVPEINP
ncbi:hypothetical protein, partial [Pseudomonas akapageensis]|uniref:hypothetical protein n=1 Tax=Pseudomonas akapageensis TaxID=2609961 RepID=UPI001C49AE97